MTIVILFLAAFVRIYRVGELLGFYFDQGRDAKVIWDLWHAHKFFLIGPTTGIEGIFRGPWYYWLITPAYILGGGNPVWPAVFLALLCVGSIAWAYSLAVQIAGRTGGMIALILSAFSYGLIMSSRWLSNPTPMLLISMLLVQSIVWLLKHKQIGWMTLGVTLGMAMQFGSAAEVFYFLVIPVLLIHQRKHINWKWVIAGGLAIVVSFLPQIIFNARHDGVLHKGIYQFLITKSSFKVSFWQTLSIRLPFYVNTFFSLILPIAQTWWLLGMALVMGLIVSWRRISLQMRYLLFIFLIPLVGMLFFQGNDGNVYGYYFTGYFSVFVLVVAVLLSALAKFSLGKLFVGIILTVFLYQNLPLIADFLRTDPLSPAAITLANQKMAVDWIYKDSQNQDFNIDVYVPPVIPHAYDYLFLWLGSTVYHRLPNPEILPRLYTLYEIDPPHPERLEMWLKRQRGIGAIEDRVIFGGITVDRSRRIKSE